MASPKIVCPECKKSFKGRDDLQGKRIRCPGCGASFVVGQPSQDDEAAAAAHGPWTAERPRPMPPDDEGEGEDANPYILHTVEIGPRLLQLRPTKWRAWTPSCAYSAATTCRPARGTARRRKSWPPPAGDWASWITSRHRLRRRHSAARLEPDRLDFLVEDDGLETLIWAVANSRGLAAGG